MKEKDIEIVRQLLNNNDYEYISKENNKYIFRDKLEYTYSLPYSRIYSTLKNEGGKFCEFYYNNEYLLYNVNNFLNINNVNLFLCDIQDEIFTPPHPKFHFYDNEGYFYYSNLDSIRNLIMGFSKNLGKFHNTNSYALNNLQHWIDIHSRPFEVIKDQEYKYYNSKLYFKCFNCPNGEIPFLATQNDITSMMGCPICENRQIGKYNSLEYRFPEIAKEFDLMKNYPITPDKIGAGNRTKYYWICPNCEFSYQCEPGSRTKKNGLGNGCPNCTSSLGERVTWTILKKFKEKYNLDFERQYKIKECRDQLPLPFDFAIWVNGVFYLLEIQGSQHYRREKSGWFSTDEVIERIKKHDKIKSDYCLNNNIPLIIIPYTEFNNIESILTYELGL